MKTSIRLLCSAVLLSSTLGASALAQGKVQTVTLDQVNPITLAQGYRTTKVVGSPVVNDAGDTIGTIDDLIVTPQTTRSLTRFCPSADFSRWATILSSSGAARSRL